MTPPTMIVLLDGAAQGTGICCMRVIVLCMIDEALTEGNYDMHNCYSIRRMNHVVSLPTHACIWPLYRTWRS